MFATRIMTLFFFVRRTTTKAILEQLYKSARHEWPFYAKCSSASAVFEIGIQSAPTQVKGQILSRNQAVLVLTFQAQAR